MRRAVYLPMNESKPNKTVYRAGDAVMVNGYLAYICYEIGSAFENGTTAYRVRVVNHAGPDTFTSVLESQMSHAPSVSA
jgi:hypothetical protein